MSDFVPFSLFPFVTCSSGFVTLPLFPFVS